MNLKKKILILLPILPLLGTRPPPVGPLSPHPTATPLITSALRHHLRYVVMSSLVYTYACRTVGIRL